MALEAERNMLQKEKKKIGEAEECWQPEKNEAEKCQGIDWAALKTLRGGGWRKAQLQVAAGAGCQGQGERGGEEPERAENPPSGSPGQASTCGTDPLSREVGTPCPFPGFGEGVREPLPKESEDFCFSTRCQSKDGDAKKIRPSTAVGNWRAHRSRKRLFCHEHTPGHTPAQVTAGKYPFLLPENGLSDGSQRNRLCSHHRHRSRRQDQEV